jgi:hypothetical protein
MRGVDIVADKKNDHHDHRNYGHGHDHENDRVHLV